MKFGEETGQSEGKSVIVGLIDKVGPIVGLNDMVGVVVVGIVGVTLGIS
jgi:hypothetical protein